MCVRLSDIIHVYHYLILRRDCRLFREAIVDTVDVCDDIIDISEDAEIIDDISSELFRS
ncbi:16803_t:CDS:2 [Entrophospora sp. SA101]|nr:16803_t:CDS:2 [Entrophospora sp. SA101]